jgi:2-polyprenyl-6-hydroxyphenyl methylase/3-demethylubiquinone-9 3-methyltransferase
MRNLNRWKVAQAFEKRWWKNYLLKRDVEEYLQWKRSYWKQFLKDIEDVAPVHLGDRVLDAGCGPAGIFIALEDQRIHALDPLLLTYEKDLPHFYRSAYPDVNFHALPLEEFETDDPFDVTFCLNVINHVRDIELSLEVLRKATKPGGLMVISTDTHNYSLLKYIFQLIPGDILHPHQYDLNDYNKLIEGVGTQVIDTRQMNREAIFSYQVIIAQNLG